MGGLEPLVLLLGASMPKIRIGAAEILRDVTLHRMFCLLFHVADAFTAHLQLLFNQLDGVAPLIEMLSRNDTRETAVAAAALTSLALSSRNCRDIRRFGGIQHLLSAMKANYRRDSTIVKNCAFALWNVSKKGSRRLLFVVLKRCREIEDSHCRGEGSQHSGELVE